jgi:hypothetical protein
MVTVSQEPWSSSGRPHTKYRPRGGSAEFLHDAIHGGQVMSKARIRLNEVLPHPCPLGALPAENHRNGRRDRGSLGQIRCFEVELSILPNGKCPLGKRFSVDGKSIREIGNGVRVVAGVGRVRINVRS